MNFFRQFQGFFQSPNYDRNVRNPFCNQLLNDFPEFDRRIEGTYWQNSFQPTNVGWSGHNPFQNYPLCSATNEHYREDNFNFQSFNGNYQYSNDKRAREWYNDDDYNGVSNNSKKQRLTGPSVKYAFKKNTQYTHPMRKAVETLFAAEIYADGWEKVNDQFQYYTKVRGTSYCQYGSSIDDAQENVAEIILKELCGFEMTRISWPNKILSFRLEQRFADEIGIMVKSKFDELMQNDVQYKAHKVRCGIVMTNGMSIDGARVVAIGTGSKCFADKLQDENGTVLHDMHAEVLARRSFIRFLYDQLIAMAGKKPSIFYLNGDEIQLQADLKFHLYVNTIPCGDARVFSLKGCAKLKKMAKQGTLRTKKIGGTENLPETNCQRIKSMSCSDKLARWNVLGLQGGALSNYIKPMYLESIILGSSYVPIHMHRAIFGRLENSLADLSSTDEYRLNKPKFESTFVMEIMNVATSEDHGICWCEGYNPEILNLNTGLNMNGEASKVSKAFFMEMFQSVSEKLSKRSDAGIEKYSEVKAIFYGALKTKNYGIWENTLN